MRFPKHIAMIAFTLTIVLFPQHCKVYAQEVGSRTAIFVLVDLSRTWFNQESQVKNIHTLDEVNKAVVGLSTRHEKPVHITFLAIEDRSALQSPLCEGCYRPTLIRRNNPCMTSKAELNRKLTLCKSLILNQNSSDYTDISGAIDIAAQMSQSPTLERKFLIILSDMKEERQIPFNFSNLHLEGFRIAIVYRILPRDALSNEYRGRLEWWESKLKECKAAKIILILDKGELANRLIMELAD